MSTMHVTHTWKTTFPGAHAGVLIMREAANPAHNPLLEKRKEELEQKLRSQYSGQDRAEMLKQPVLQAYAAYYHQFKKTYHVQLQLESLLFKGKAIPSAAPLVEAMFMAEMNNLLLTAGHDLDAVHAPVTLDVAMGSESYTLLRGEAQIAKAGDMMIVDREGIISSIVHGPDQRTQIRAETRNVLFTVYAPSGIRRQLIEHHLEEIQQNVRLVAENAQLEILEIFAANQSE
jgi:DNA/RNA-binding domain of Phe-tRNA-synthetase-like protein